MQYLGGNSCSECVYGVKLLRRVQFDLRDWCLRSAQMQVNTQVLVGAAQHVCCFNAVSSEREDGKCTGV